MQLYLVTPTRNGNDACIKHYLSYLKLLSFHLAPCGRCLKTGCTQESKFRFSAFQYLGRAGFSLVLASFVWSI